MKRKEPTGQSHYIYNHQGSHEVSEQIMDSYNSGVIDHADGKYDATKALENEESESV